MATVNLGRVGLVLKGEYDASTKYEKLDVVTYQGSSYIAKQTTTGNAPTNESFWQLQSEKGEKGDKGDAGGGLTRLDDQTPVTVDGVLAGKNGKLAPADFVPAEILPTNTVAQAGIVAAPTANNANSLWSTDGSGNPAWRYYDYQTKAQIQQLIATAISESGHASFEKIDHIPNVSEAKDNILYLVYNTKTAHYDIYAKVVNEKGTPEVLLIDDTTVDLSDYVTNEALAAKNYATNSALQAATTEINTNLNNKVDKESGKGLSSNDYTAAEKSKLAGIEASADVNKIESVKLNGSALPIDTQKAVNIDLSGYATDSELSTGLSLKVDKQEGKQLSTEDFTTAYKNKLDGIPEGGGGGEVNIINTVKVNGTALVPDAQKAVDVKAYNEDNKPEVGGRNLLRYTKNLPIGPSDIHVFRPSASKLEDLEGSIKMTYSTMADGIIIPFVYDTAISGKETLTLSFDIKSNVLGPFTGLVYIFQRVGDNKIIGVTNLEKVSSEDWAHVTQSFNVDDANLGTGYAICILYRTATTESEWVEIRKSSLKLERGEIATDWTPAPEDLEAEIPIKTSELQNDSGFITQADIPEGAAASNTVPKAPAATGSVGNELAFARGDHVHPMQPGIGNPIKIPENSDLNDYKDAGAYYCYGDITAGTIKNSPLGANSFSLLVVENHANEGLSQIVISYRLSAKSFIRNYESYGGWGSWEQYAYLSSLNASNFTGVLPVEKGGTGSSTGAATSSKIGLIKPGTGLAVTNDGTLNVTASAVGPKGDKGDTGPQGPAGVSPTATVSKSGSVATITIKDANGTTTATVSDGATGPQGPQGLTGPAGPTNIASKTILGGIKVGSGLSATTDGTLSVAKATNSVIGGVKVGTGNGLAISAAGELMATQAGTAQRGSVIIGDNINVVPTTGKISVPDASTTTKGVVKVGSGLTIDSNGALSVSDSGGTVGSYPAFVVAVQYLSSSQVPNGPGVMIYAYGVNGQAVSRQITNLNSSGHTFSIEETLLDTTSQTYSVKLSITSTTLQTFITASIKDTAPTAAGSINLAKFTNYLLLMSSSKISATGVILS